MPSQAKIISAVNYCLNERGTTDFTLNDSGVCAGLAGLFIKYALDNKLPAFYKLLDKLGDLPKNYKSGDDPEIDDFIIQIETVFSPSKYNNKVGQGELEKILSINNQPLRREFNLGLVADDKGWTEILTRITKANRGFFIASDNHAVAIYVRGNEYVLYDPNDQAALRFKTAAEIIEELKLSFQYTEDSFGLSMIAFANPTHTPAVYPPHAELHALALDQQKKIRSKSKKEGVEYATSQFARIFNDTDTINYLFQENAIEWDLLQLEASNPEFIQRLLGMEKSDKIKKALTQGINTNLAYSKIDQTRVLINRYNELFTSAEDKQAFHKMLNDFFSTTVNTKNYSPQDYQPLLDLLTQEGFDNSTNTTITSNYNHITLLNYLHHDKSADTYNSFLNSLTTEQLVLQIQFAATHNQRTILHKLIEHFKSQNFNPKEFASIYNEELLQNIDSMSLKLLLDNGFLADSKRPELINTSYLRKNKNILEQYFRSFLQQTSQSALWEAIDKNDHEAVDLKMNVGPLPLINVLIFLKKNELIKRAWKDTKDPDLIICALTASISSGNIHLATFFSDKLNKAGATLDADSIEYLIDFAVQKDKENINILQALTELDINILTKKENAINILRQCQNHNQYEPLEKSYTKANLPIKKQLLKEAILFDYKPAITICAEKDTDVFSGLLKDCIVNKDQEGLLIALHDKVHLFPKGLNLNLKEAETKSFVAYCLEHNLSKFAGPLLKSVTWSDSELQQLASVLLKAKNQKGMITLIESSPGLVITPDFLNSLINQNMFDAVDSLIKNKLVAIDEVTAARLFVGAMNNDHQGLITTLIEQELVTAKSTINPTVVELLKSSVAKGFNNSVQAVLNSKINFGIDYKELFHLSCAHQKPAIANQLLEKSLPLEEKEIKAAFKQLFGNQPTEALYDQIYKNGFGRLYRLFMLVSPENPKGSLMSSIQNPGQDPKFQTTAIYSKLVMRALAEKNEGLFKKLFEQANTSTSLDTSILDLLKDPFLPVSIIEQINNKYGLDRLLQLALDEKDWAAVSRIIANAPLTTFTESQKATLIENKAAIIDGYIKNLRIYFDKGDIRPRLFNLLNPENPSVLFILAADFTDLITKELETTELEMISQKRALNSKLYRLQMSQIDFKEALGKLKAAIAETQGVITEQKIDITRPIHEEQIVDRFSTIKKWMMDAGITTYYLEDSEEDLLTELSLNDRFKTACELELKVYALMQEYDLGEVELAALPQTKRSALNSTLEALRAELLNKQLPLSFIVPSIRIHLQTLPAADLGNKADASNADNFSKPDELPITKPVEPTSPPTVIRTTVIRTTPDDLPKPEEMPIVKPVETISLPKPVMNKTSDYKKRMADGIENYLTHRKKTLSFISSLFDATRGERRALCYKSLIKECERNDLELLIVQYALLVNPEGKQLKKDVAKDLGFKSLAEAKKEVKAQIKEKLDPKLLTQVDKLIEAINKKANANPKDIPGDELNILHSLIGKSEYSQPKPESAKKPQKLGFFEWIHTRMEKTQAVEDLLSEDISQRPK